MNVIGLTGSVGSGKSTIGKLLEEHFSVKLLMTDQIGHLAMAPGTSSYDKIVSVFQREILKEDQTIDRGKLSEIVFADAGKLEQLNGIIHPWVKDYLKETIETEKQAGRYEYCVIESAILFQTQLDQMCDHVWYVDTEDSVRRQRLKQSRGYTDAKIDSILKEQEENEQLKTRCQYVIENNGELSSVLSQLEKLVV